MASSNPSASGYPGVRRNGTMWQAKHGRKIYGNFVDPYEAACELARQLGREPPVENFQHTLVAAYMRIPPERLAAECQSALAHVERLRAEGGGEEEKAPPPPMRKLTPAEMTRHARMNAIKIWWHHLWTSGQTFHLNCQRGMLFVEFEKYEKKQLWERLPHYKPMVDSVFLKLLKDVVSKETSAVKSSTVPQVDMWVIDANVFCPPELREQWEAVKTRRAEAARQRRVQLEAEKTTEAKRAAEAEVAQATPPAARAAKAAAALPATAVVQREEEQAVVEEDEQFAHHALLVSRLMVDMPIEVEGEAYDSLRAWKRGMTIALPSGEKLHGDY